MDKNGVLILYFAFFTLELIVSLILTGLNLGHVKKNSGAVPRLFEKWFDLEWHQKSADYTLQKGRYSVVSTLINALILGGIILSGLLGIIDSWIAGFNLHPYAHGIVYIFTLFLVFEIISIPFSIYSTFVLEQRFGFNKTTPGLFISDMVKSLILSAIISIPLLLGLFWFMDTAGDIWWILAFGAIAVFQIIMVIIYPIFIAPMFNKFEPLEEGPLRDKLFALAKKLRFTAEDIFIMDGSKRSGHSNAYFTGFGKAKRIVLFDTLVKNLEEDHIVAILAHEIGHFKKKHIIKRMITSLISLLAGLFILDLLLNFQPLFEAFGFSGTGYHSILIILGFCAGPFTFFLTPLGAIWSRKHEFEADNFAIDGVGNASDLQEGLIKLSKDNLSNLNPHKAYSFFYYSHPSLGERITAMEDYYKKNSPNKF